MTNKVKVRIAVAVDRNGEVNTGGWSGHTDEQKMCEACAVLEDGAARYWIEAELSLPTEATVVSDVVVREAE